MCVVISLQQTEYIAAALVGLGQHGLGGLQQDVGPGIGGEGFDHIGIPDHAFGGGDIFVGGAEVSGGKVQPHLHGADGDLLLDGPVKGAVYNGDGRIGFGLRDDADGSAVAFFEPK